MWTGTDSLMLIDTSMRRPRKRIIWWIFRILIWILDRWYVEEHWVDHRGLRDNLERFGVRKPISEHEDRHIDRGITLTPHPGINVLFYCPAGGDRDFRRWLYGVDVYEWLKKELPHINWIEVDGGQDLADILPYIDIYIRPNRHDGKSRLATECRKAGIHVLHTRRGEWGLSRWYFELKKTISLINAEKSRVTRR